MTYHFKFGASLVCMMLAGGVAHAAEKPYADSGAGFSTNKSLMEMVQRMDLLENELRQLRGDLEVLFHDMRGVNWRQREMYLDVDRRLRELELSAVTPPKPVPGAPDASAPAGSGATLSSTQLDKPISQENPPVASVPSSASTPAAAPPDRDERDAYNRAYNLLKEGRYDQSVTAFKEFLKAYPQSSYADNSQYWLGEANYVSRKFKEAVEEFNHVINKFPQSPKVSDAMLKLGFTYYELGDWKLARATLQEVLKNYSGSSAARLAETRLQRMSKEGH